MKPLKTNQTPAVLNHGIIIVAQGLYCLSTLQFTAAQPGNSSSPPSPDDTYSLQEKFNPSIAIVMVFLVSAFFLLGFFSVYVRQCAERRSGNAPYDPTTALGGIGRRSRRRQGIDETVIETYFPTFLYSSVKGLQLGNDALECAVCLNEFEDEQTLRLIPKCSHVFHPGCIDAWLASHTTCPVCRANLVPKPGDLPFSSVGIQEPGHPSSNVNDQLPVQDSGDSDQIREVLMPETQYTSANLLNSANQNRPPRSWSTGWRLRGLFPRSYSTGHPLVPPREDHDRFTLRLPEDVRSQLMNTHLNRTKSCVVFSRMSSSRQGYRSRSVSTGRERNYFYHDRFDHEGRPDRWSFMMTPPFIFRTSSLPSAKGTRVGDDEVHATPPRNFLRAMKAPFGRLFPGTDKDTDKVDDFGECSFDRLIRPDSKV